jgi:hypothetical protein
VLHVGLLKSTVQKLITELCLYECFQSKSKLSTYIVASGLTYGCGENIFHHLFKVKKITYPKFPCVLS